MSRPPEPGPPPVRAPARPSTYRRPEASHNPLHAAVPTGRPHAVANR